MGTTRRSREKQERGERAEHPDSVWPSAKTENGASRILHLTLGSENLQGCLGLFHFDSRVLKCFNRLIKLIRVQLKRDN